MLPSACGNLALSDVVAQTRVQNLVIDVVGQSVALHAGCYQSSKRFYRGREQHYSVHVAIDRFTGQVLDKQIEVVNE